MVKFPLHALWIGLLGNIVVFSVGYIASLVSPAKIESNNKSPKAVKID
jgi:hypothetical protein